VRSHACLYPIRHGGTFAPEALTVVLEMPGVDRNSIEPSVEDDIVTIAGRIDFTKYEGMQPVYTEYNVGNYARGFEISNKIDQSRISVPR
jgi:HSP20 family molecular chaperone IbpA